MKYFYKVAVTVSICLSLAFSASAHISLKQSSPANDAMLMQSPKQLSLTFSDKVRVAKVTLSGKNSQAINFDFKPATTLNSQFYWDLPSLSEGNYKVEWIVLGEDGHKMTGGFSFNVHGHSPGMGLMKQKSDLHGSHSH